MENINVVGKVTIKPTKKFLKETLLGQSIVMGGTVAMAALGAEAGIHVGEWIDTAGHLVGTRRK